MVRLGDVCEVVSGSTPKSAVREYWGGFVKWVTPAELSEDDYYVHDTERHLSELGVKSANLHMMPVGTVLLSSRAPIGKVAITAAEMTCNQGFKNLICSSDLHNRYLYYFLKKNKTYLNSLGRGATFKEISKEIVADIKLPLPPLKVQNHMADILDKITFIIDLRKQQLNKLDLLIKSRFIEMFGDPVTNSQSRPVLPFKSFMTCVRYGTSQPPTFCENGPFCFIRATNIKAGRIVEQEMLTIDEPAAAGIQKCKLNGGEIIIVRSGVNTGDTCVITPAHKGDYAGYDIIVSLNGERANPVFFNELLNTHYMDKVVKPLTARSAQPHINSEQVQNLPMLDVPIAEQNRFAAFVESTDKSKFTIKRGGACRTF